jgi:bifunctional non-homologous end joining protein LigD
MHRKGTVPYAHLVGAKAGPLPAAVQPQLATLATRAPDGDQWLHEIKFDGYRMICRIDDGRVELASRNQNIWTDRFRFLAEAATQWPFRQAILDGEVVAMRPDGTTDFELLQTAFRDHRERDLLYYVFDILYFDGWDLRGVPLEGRKQLLAELVAATSEPGPLRLSQHIEGKGPAVFDRVCQTGAEGIVSKRRDRPYTPGRSYDWLKIKGHQTAEFVVGGYTPPEGSRIAFGALLLGYYHDEGQLVYAGKVGTGFDRRALKDILARLEPLRQPRSPFAKVKGVAEPERGALWVKPELVAQVRFGNWTRDGVLRHPSFQGLREDKPASAVRREEPVPVAEAVRESAKRKGRAVTESDSRGRVSPRLAPASRRDAATCTPAYDAKKQEFRGVRLTSPEKVLYPDQGITKLDLATYYATIADWILPHVAGRPLVLTRCPEGQHEKCFYQKHPRVGTPANLRQVAIREKSDSEESQPYVVVDDVAGLISLAQIAALEIHAWGSKADSRTNSVEKPDRLIFDLDPDPAVPWSRVVEGAHQIREFLEDLGLRSFVKTTGGKGLHLVIPIGRRHGWDEVKIFCHRVAKTIASADPGRYTVNIAKAARPGKIFIDYLRNSRGATSVAPYSTRAKPGAPVSTPLDWRELTADIRSDQFTLRNVPQRLASLKRDPWEGIASLRQSLSKAVIAKLGRWS